MNIRIRKKIRNRYGFFHYRDYRKFCDRMGIKKKLPDGKKFRWKSLYRYYPHYPNTNPIVQYNKGVIKPPAAYYWLRSTANESGYTMVWNSHRPLSPLSVWMTGKPNLGISISV